MKYLKGFNESNSEKLYKSIPTKNGFYSDMSSYKSEPFVDVEISEISKFFISTKLISKAGSHLECDYMYNFSRYTLEIWKKNDEWYYVAIEGGPFIYMRGLDNYTKCDSFDGLIQFLSKCFSKKKILENKKLEYGVNEKDDKELISDLFLEYHDKWNLDEKIHFEGLRRYLMIIDFETCQYRNDDIVDDDNELEVSHSKVDNSNIDEFKKDLNVFIDRVKKYASICFVDYIYADIDDYEKDMNHIISAWVIIDFDIS